MYTKDAPLVAHPYYVENMATQGWSNMVSISTASSVGPILWELSLAARRKHIHASEGRVPGEDNNMADAALPLTPLPDRKFISHLRINFPQSKPWRLPPLTSGYNQQLTTMLHNKQSPRGYWPPSLKKIATAWHQW